MRDLYLGLLISLLIHALVVVAIWHYMGSYPVGTIIPVRVVLSGEGGTEAGTATSAYKGKAAREGGGGRKADGEGRRDEGRRAMDNEPQSVGARARVQEQNEEGRGKREEGQPKQDARPLRLDDGRLKMDGRETADAKKQAEERSVAGQAIKDGPVGRPGSPSGADHGAYGGRAGTDGGAGTPSYGVRTSTAALSGRGTGPGGDSLSGQIDERLYKEIRDRVMKNVEYPERARRTGLEGKVVTSFTLREDGSIVDAKVVKSSGSTVLDEAALKALARSSFKQKRERSVSVVLPIEYKLK